MSLAEAIRSLSCRLCNRGGGGGEIRGAFPPSGMSFGGSFSGEGLSESQKDSSYSCGCEAEEEGDERAEDISEELDEPADGDGESVDVMEWSGTVGASKAIS